MKDLSKTNRELTEENALLKEEILKLGQATLERQRIEEAFKESELKYRSLIEHSSDVVFCVDKTGSYKFVNQVFASTFGQTPDYFLGKTFWDIYPKEHADYRQATSIKVFETGESQSLEVVVPLPDKTLYYIAKANPVRDETGKVVLNVTHAIDITGRKRAEVALREREVLLSRSQEIAHIGSWKLDVTANRLTWSDEVYRIFGCELQAFAVTYQAFLDFVHPDDRAAVDEAYSRSLREGSDGYEIEHRIVWRNSGEVRYVHERCVHERDDAGAIIQSIGMVQDITERKEAERRLRVELQRANSYLNASATIMVALDNSGTIIMLNRYGLDLLGYEEEEIIGRNWFETALPQPQGMEQIYPAFRRIIGGDLEPMRYFENEIITASGERRLIAWSNNNYLDDRGRITGTLSSGMDITDIKRAEAEREDLHARLSQAQKMESVGRLAGGVAHDFNNMLGVILGHTEMALEQVDPAQPIHADLTEILKAAGRSADLTRQLLAFARKQTVAPRVLDLNKAISGMLKMLQRLIGEDIYLNWNPEADLWPVKVDPSQIDQILANLCVNARDAISGIGKLTIETKNSAFDEDYCATHAGFVSGEYVRLAISDSGCGMDKETLSHLYEPFFTTKETGKGTGLGLATVYGIVKQNSGFINVYSEPGQGTTFTIYLPRHASKVEQQLRTEGAPQSVDRGNETILLAEDEPALLELTTMLLKRQGYTVLAASTPGEAIRLAREHSGEINLLITDVIMPEMNGRDLARNLLALYPHMKRLFTSGYTADIIAHHGVLDEGVHFMQKPFSRKDLAVKVREALDQK